MGTTDFSSSCGKRGDIVGVTLTIICTKQNEKDMYVFNLYLIAVQIFLRMFHCAEMFVGLLFV
jgi:hypothetical protein